MPRFSPADYLSPAAAFSDSLEETLLQNQALKHQQMMDEITQRREARLEEQDKLNLELRREELNQKRAEADVRLKDKRADMVYKALSEAAPGDVLPQHTIDEARQLGIPLRLGAAPTIPQGQPQVQMPGQTVDPITGAQAAPKPVPMPGAQPAQSFESARSYLGSPQQEAQRKLADIIEQPGTDRTKITAGALRLGVDPRSLGQIMTAETGPKPTTASTFVVRDAQGKEIPGIVSVQNGAPLLNGGPIPPGATVTSRSNAVDTSPLTPEETRLASDVASGRMTYDQLLKLYSFQRSGRERARMIYNDAREQNVNLSPVGIAAELKSYQGALDAAQKTKSAVDAYAKSAEKNYGMLEPILNKIPDTGFAGTPNEWARQANKFLGSADQVTFNALMKSLQSEYTRLIENPNLTGVVTQASRDDLKEIAGTSLTLPQIRTLFATLRQESQNRSSALGEQINTIRGEIGGVAHQPGSDSGGSGGTTSPPKRKSLDDLAKDIYGRPNQAAGASVPASAAPVSAPLRIGASPKDIELPKESGVKISDSGVENLRRREGFSATPYQDSGGLAIGYGMHTWKGQPVTKGLTITKEQADQELARQVQTTYAPIIDRSLKVPVTQAQYDALISMAWNRPASVLGIIAKLNRHEKLTPADFQMSATAQGQPNQGLSQRRAEEYAPFAGGTPNGG